MEKKIRVLHLWYDKAEVERFVRQMAETGLEFEAALVNSETDFASSLINKQFDIVIADERADFTLSGPEHLSALDIALEIAPDVPFVVVGEPKCFSDAAEPFKAGRFRIERQSLELLGPLLRKLFIEE